MGGEIKDRLNDALNATKAALEEGIVAGGGAALLRASKKLDGLKLDNFEQQVGVDAIKAALKRPCMQIVSNAGEEGAVVVAEILKSEDQSYGSTPPRASMWTSSRLASSTRPK